MWVYFELGIGYHSLLGQLKATRGFVRHNSPCTCRSPQFHPFKLISLDSILILKYSSSVRLTLSSSREISYILKQYSDTVRPGLHEPIFPKRPSDAISFFESSLCHRDRCTADRSSLPPWARSPSSPDIGHPVILLLLDYIFSLPSPAYCHTLHTWDTKINTSFPPTVSPASLT